MSKKIIALISDDFEDLELWYLVHRLREEEGVTVDVVGEEKGKTYIGKYGVPCVSDYRFDEINPDEYDGILVPGGWAPDKLSGTTPRPLSTAILFRPGVRRIFRST